MKNLRVLIKKIIFHKNILFDIALIKTLIIPTVIILQLSDKFKSLTFKIVQPKGSHVINSQSELPFDTSDKKFSNIILFELNDIC